MVPTSFGNRALLALLRTRKRSGAVQYAALPRARKAGLWMVLAVLTGIGLAHLLGGGA